LLNRLNELGRLSLRACVAGEPWLFGLDSAQAALVLRELK